jgi:hypothetical protein
MYEKLLTARARDFISRYSSRRTNEIYFQPCKKSRAPFPADIQQKGIDNHFFTSFSQTS